MSISFSRVGVLAVFSVLFGIESLAQKNKIELYYSFPNRHRPFVDVFQTGRLISNQIGLSYYRKVSSNRLSGFYWNTGVDLSLLRLETTLNYIADDAPFYDAFVDFFGFCAGINHETVLKTDSKYRIGMLNGLHATYVLPVYNVEIIKTHGDSTHTASFFFIDYNKHNHIRVSLNCSINIYKMLSAKNGLSIGLKLRYFINPMRELEYVNYFNQVQTSAGTYRKNSIILALPVAFAF
jgi:hypothetical protein